MTKFGILFILLSSFLFLPITFAKDVVPRIGFKYEFYEPGGKRIDYFTWSGDAGLRSHSRHRAEDKCVESLSNSLVAAMRSERLPEIIAAKQRVLTVLKNSANVRVFVSLMDLIDNHMNSERSATLSAEGLDAHSGSMWVYGTGELGLLDSPKKEGSCSFTPQAVIDVIGQLETNIKNGNTATKAAAVRAEQVRAYMAKDTTILSYAPEGSKYATIRASLESLKYFAKANKKLTVAGAIKGLKSMGITTPSILSSRDPNQKITEVLKDNLLPVQ